MEAFDDVGLEGFPLFLVWVLVLVCDEISVCAVEGEHQTMKFTMSGDGDFEGWGLGVALLARELLAGLGVVVFVWRMVGCGWS